MKLWNSNGITNHQLAICRLQENTKPHVAQRGTDFANLESLTRFYDCAKYHYKHTPLN
jgi:hypothetical protein